MFRKLQVCMIVSCMLSYAAAGTLSIGTASVRGEMRVDSSSVKGSATLFDGSVVETGQASADLHLSQGNEITMYANSRATLHSDRLVLNEGKSELTGSGSYQLDANGLRVTPSGPNSRGVVQVKSSNAIEVEALAGSFGVTNNQGILLANVRPGGAISFAVQATTEASTVKMTGTIDVHFVHSGSGTTKYYTLTDPMTHVTAELRGDKVGDLAGLNVNVEGSIIPGTMPMAGATMVVRVTSVVPVAPADKAVVAAAVVSHTALTVAVIGGVAVAGTVGGLAAAGTFSSRTPASR